MNNDEPTEIDALKLALVAADSELFEYAKTVGELRAALYVCRESLREQAQARADPGMPRLVPSVVKRLREHAEANYALAEDREDRVVAHSLSLLCDWQDPQP